MRTPFISQEAIIMLLAEMVQTRTDGVTLELRDGDLWVKLYDGKTYFETYSRLDMDGELDG